MNSNYRYLDLSKEQVKNYFKLKAKNLATEVEKLEFDYFNLSSFYFVYSIKFIHSVDAEEYCKEYDINKSVITQKIVLIMNKKVF